MLIPIKNKKKKKKSEQKVEKELTKKATSNRKKYFAKKWAIEKTNLGYNRFRKLFNRYEKKAKKYIGTDSDLLLYHYL